MFIEKLHTHCVFISPPGLGLMMAKADQLLLQPPLVRRPHMAAMNNLGPSKISINGP